MASEAKPYTKSEVAIGNAVIPIMSRLNTWAYRLTAGLCGRSPLFDRHPIPHAEAQAEAAALDELRLERTYTAPPAAGGGA